MHVQKCLYSYIKSVCMNVEILINDMVAQIELINDLFCRLIFILFYSLHIFSMFMESVYNIPKELVTDRAQWRRMIHVADPT